MYSGISPHQANVMSLPFRQTKSNIHTFIISITFIIKARGWNFFLKRCFYCVKLTPSPQKYDMGVDLIHPALAPLKTTKTLLPSYENTRQFSVIKKSCVQGTDLFL